MPVITSLDQPVAVSEVNYQPASVTPGTGTLSAPGRSSTFIANAGRAAYLTLSGGTSLTGAVQWSFDAGSTWANIFVEGIQLGVITYSGTTMTIAFPTPEKTQAQISLSASAVSGTVTYTFTA